MRFLLVAVCALAIGAVIGTRRAPPVPHDDARLTALEVAVAAQAARVLTMEQELAALRARPAEVRMQPGPLMPFEPDEMVAWVELAQARQEAKKAVDEHERFFAAMLEETHATPEQARRLREICAEQYRAHDAAKDHPYTDEAVWNRFDEAKKRAMHEAAAVLGSTDEDFPYCL